ncbi:hypothetical protein KUF71_006939 [Frankliniella fusca]|uniref:Uncharacterized protein n=1 Tax=Frankliniella fusca TaxID=407009 RepID=A0AAE1HAH0_9NEOP|nr:hypothetical protein KUF71_006939 [Frankliniella fusca]
MLPNPPRRHLHQRLHLHQQRHQQHRRESRLLQDERLDLLLPRGVPGPGPGSPAGSLSALTGPPCPAGPAIRKAPRARVRSASMQVGAAATTGKAPRRHSNHARAARKAASLSGPGPEEAGAAAAGAHQRGPPHGHQHGHPQGAQGPLRPSPFHPRGSFSLRTPLGVIDSSPELAASLAGSPAGSLGSQVFPQAQGAATPPARSGAALAGPAGPAADANNDSPSSSCLVLPYGAPCESFELAEIAYGEAAAPLARIATLETASVRDGEGVDSGSDSVFGVARTQHGQAPDTTAEQADTGVDTGQDADTDQDADGQLSTDSNGSGSSTPHQLVNHRKRLYVLPVGLAPVSGADSVTLHEAPSPGRHKHAHLHPGSTPASTRPRLARTPKVLAVSLDSAASDDCVTTTPEQSQEEQALQREDQDAVGVSLEALAPAPGPQEGCKR